MPGPSHPLWWKQARPPGPASLSGPNLEAGVYPDLHLYVRGGGGCGDAVSCRCVEVGACRGPAVIGGCAPAVLSPGLSGHQVWVRGRSEARGSQEFLAPDPKSPVRSKADRRHLGRGLFYKPICQAIVSAPDIFLFSGIFSF